MMARFKLDVKILSIGPAQSEIRFSQSPCKIPLRNEIKVIFILKKTRDGEKRINCFLANYIIRELNAIK